MLKLAIYGIAILVAIGVLAYAVNKVVLQPLIAVGVSRQTTKDAPVIANLTTARDAALAANKTLSAGVDQCQATANAANEKLDALNQAQNVAETSAKAAIAKALHDAQEARESAATAKLTAIATAPVVNETEVQACEDARSILSDLARARRVQQ